MMNDEWLQAMGTPKPPQSLPKGPLSPSNRGYWPRAACARAGRPSGLELLDAHAVELLRGRGRERVWRGRQIGGPRTCDLVGLEQGALRPGQHDIRAGHRHVN